MECFVVGFSRGDNGDWRRIVCSNQIISCCWFWGGLSLNLSRTTFLIFAMIGANIISVVARESIRKSRRYNINCVNNGGSGVCSYYLFQSFHTYKKGINSNPGSYLFPIWWDECIRWWSVTNSHSQGAKKWQVLKHQHIF